MRGQGLGTRLIHTAFEEARIANVPLMVTSEPASHSFFLRHGFEDGKHVDMDLSKYMPAYSGFGLFRMTRMAWFA